LPFVVLLLSVKQESEHSPDEKVIGCHSMLERVIRKEIDGGVSYGGFSVNANFEVCCIPGY
jgi:hypothetical protein